MSAIIFNQKNNENQRFKVKYKLYFGDRLAEKRMLKYTFVYDSTLTHSSRRNKSLIRIKDSLFIPIDFHDDSIPTWKTDFYSKDINDIKNNLLYYNGHNYQADSILYYQESGPRLDDSIFMKPGLDTTTIALKVLYNEIASDSIEIKRFLFQKGAWVPFYSFLITESRERNSQGFVVTKHKKGMSYGVNYSHWPTEDNVIDSKRVAKYYVENDKIVRVEISFYSDSENERSLYDTIVLKVIE